MSNSKTLIVLTIGSLLFAACVIGLIYLLQRVASTNDPPENNWIWTSSDTTVVFIVVGVTFIMALVIGILKYKKNSKSTTSLYSTPTTSTSINSTSSAILSPTIESAGGEAAFTPLNKSNTLQSNLIP